LKNRGGGEKRSPTSRVIGKTKSFHHRGARRNTEERPEIERKRKAGHDVKYKVLSHHPLSL